MYLAILFIQNFVVGLYLISCWLLAYCANTWKLWVCTSYLFDTVSDNGENEIFWFDIVNFDCELDTTLCRLACLELFILKNWQHYYDWAIMFLSEKILLLLFDDRFNIGIKLRLISILDENTLNYFRLCWVVLSFDWVLPAWFFPKGDWGSPQSSKNFVNPPHIRHLSLFLDQGLASPPPAEARPQKFQKFKYIFVSNLTTFKLKSTLKSCISCLKY